MDPLADLPPATSGSWSIPVGISADHLTPAHWDLSRSNGIVIGARGTGRSTAMRTVAAMGLIQGIEPLVVTGRNREEVIASLTLIRASLAAATERSMVVLDDLDHWVEDAEVDELVCELTRSARNGTHRLLASMDRYGAQRSYSEAIPMLRHARNALLLGPDAPDLGPLVDTDLPRRDDIVMVTGRGYLVSSGIPEIVQVGITHQPGVPVDPTG
jgi:hypothetical protein